jgi:hypothetical protein
MEASDPRLAASTYALIMAVSNLGALGGGLFSSTVAAFGDRFGPAFLISAVAATAALPLAWPLGRPAPKPEPLDVDASGAGGWAASRRAWPCSWRPCRGWSGRCSACCSGRAIGSAWPAGSTSPGRAGPAGRQPRDLDRRVPAGGGHPAARQGAGLRVVHRQADPAPARPVRGTDPGAGARPSGAEGRHRGGPPGAGPRRGGADLPRGPAHAHRPDGPVPPRPGGPAEGARRGRGDPGRAGQPLGQPVQLLGGPVPAETAAGLRRTVCVAFGPPVPPPVTAFSVRQAVLVAGVRAAELLPGGRASRRPSTGRCPTWSTPSWACWRSRRPTITGATSTRRARSRGPSARPRRAWRCGSSTRPAGPLPPDAEGRVQALLPGRPDWAETGYRGHLDRDGFLRIA